MRELSRFDRILLDKYFPNETDLTNNLKKINFNLLYSYYPRFDSDEGKFIFYISKHKNNSRNDKWLLGNKPSSKDKYNFFDERLIKKISDNYYNSISDLQYQLEETTLQPEWRMNIGLGGESVYETGITLHHIYGFPYIPATAIKGITHHYANEQKKEKKIDEKLILEIFGSESEDSDNPQKGKVIFFDTFPVDEIILSPDIMNNHYPDYYDNAKKPPADWQSPRPILFLTVKDTSFKFVVGMKPKDYTKNPDLLNEAIDLLKNALQEKGIGAKTAVGYGYMTENN